MHDFVIRCFIIKVMKNCKLEYLLLVYSSYIGLPGPLSGPSLEHFSLKNFFLYFFCQRIRSEKISYIFSKEVFLVFQDMELSGPKLKKFVIFLQKTFCYVLGNVNFLKKLLTFQEIEFLALRLKDFLYFLKTFFLCFGKRNFLKKLFIF